MDFAEIRSRLAALDTACLADADKTIRALDPAIRPIRTDLKLVGRAHTVTCRDDFLGVIRALQQAEPGDVLVVDGQGGSKALAGELFATECARKGLAGLVIDGGVRDTATLRTLDLPVYARFVHPVSGTAARIAKTQTTIRCGGATVAPGDIVFGDADGVIVATASQFARLIPTAEDIQRIEARALAAMHAGTSLLDLLTFDDHYAATAAGRPSRLAFKTVPD